jgi:hypothetical protein
MFRSFLTSITNSRRPLAFSAPRGEVWPANHSASIYYQPICLFSTAEIPSKIKDVKKMLVADLKSGLMTRGASVQGKKADLVERLLAIIEYEKRILALMSWEAEDMDELSIKEGLPGWNDLDYGRYLREAQSKARQMEFCRTRLPVIYAEWRLPEKRANRRTIK